MLPSRRPTAAPELARDASATLKTLRVRSRWRIRPMATCPIPPPDHGDTHPPAPHGRIPPIPVGGGKSICYNVGGGLSRMVPTDRHGVPAIESERLLQADCTCDPCLRGGDPIASGHACTGTRYCRSVATLPSLATTAWSAHGPRRRQRFYPAGAGDARLQCLSLSIVTFAPMRTCWRLGGAPGERNGLRRGRWREVAHFPLMAAVFRCNIGDAAINTVPRAAAKQRLGSA